MTKTWGWAGSVRAFLSTPIDAWLADLSAHLHGLLGKHPSATQLAAWRDEHGCVTDALKWCSHVDAAPLEWGIAFEYELPLEGGRRPDVVVLAGDVVNVLEFKSSASASPADLDQVRAYARDLADYHKESHGRRVQPILVLMGAKGALPPVDETIVTGPDDLHRYLYESSGEEQLDVDAWVGSAYEPLPTLVAAAKRIFRHEPLPHVYTALSAGIPQALEYLLELCRSTERRTGRALAFVTGVPGSGKTLVGLRLVYEGSTMEGKAAFLSGNGPLVEVLRNALGSGVFVKDLHKIILDYGSRGRVPREHIIVFDEAQRAWDRDRVLAKRRIDASEPDLLVRAGEQVTGWSVLVGLVGEGQEIYAGEEAGMVQWATAVRAPNAQVDWDLHCPTKLAHEFPDATFVDHLDLNVSLRSRRASLLHEWVRMLLAGELSDAARLAVGIHHEGFAMYLTRDLDEAKAYARSRYEGHDEARYGLLASSHADRFLEGHGIPAGFRTSVATGRFGRWYNAPPDDPGSCCSFQRAATEFGCQGLELDLPVVGWGNDLTWSDTREWKLRPKRRRDFIDDPEQLLRNAYRVLLTRGRDGFVVFLPADAQLDGTELALLAAGVRPLPEPVSLPLRIDASGGAA
jgi:Schlafen group 3, DNA/RNA helicase domain